jgi:hypothetical protein
VVSKEMPQASDAMECSVMAPNVGRHIKAAAPARKPDRARNSRLLMTLAIRSLNLPRIITERLIVDPIEIDESWV